MYNEIALPQGQIAEIVGMLLDVVPSKPYNRFGGLYKANTL